MKIPLMETRSHLIDCPVCGQAIEAVVSVKIALFAKEREGDVVPVEAKTTMERFHVTHHCSGRAEAADPARPTTPEEATR